MKLYGYCHKKRSDTSSVFFGGIVKKLVVAFTIGIIFFSTKTNAQNLLEPEELKAAKTYSDLQEALANRDSVIKLSLVRKKLKEFPAEVFTFPNLQVLVLSRNNIAQVPADIKKLKNLQELNLSNNNLTQLPAEIGHLKNLLKLKLNRNKITSLPPEIGNLTNLEVFEMWDNELDTVPDEIKNLTQLKVFELRGILFSDNQQDEIRALLPHTKIYFSPSCACKE
ncbi:MAG: leucine-rich repeat domain-containing protein [Bacteroidia bacterium]